MDIQLLSSHAVDALRRDGFRGMLSKAVAYLRHRREVDDFDARHGTDTGGVAPSWRLQISSPNRRFGVRYEATGERELLDAIEFLREDLSTFVFVDLGCGKGRTLLVASTLGFKAVVGVEFARELVETARRNLAKVGVANAVVDYCDAADFRFPNTNLIVYLYNPFSREVLQQVLTRLRASHSARLYVIYKVPEQSAALDSSDFLSRLGCPPTRPYIQVWRSNEATTCPMRV